MAAGARCGRPFVVSLELTAKVPLKVKRLVLRLAEFEHGDFTDYSERVDESGQKWDQRASAEFYQETPREERVVGEDLALAEGEVFRAELELTVGEDARPSYTGRWFRHGFKLEAVAEIPWAVDLEARCEFALGPARDEVLPATGRLRSVESVEAEVAVRPQGEEESTGRLWPRAGSATCARPSCRTYPSTGGPPWPVCGGSTSASWGRVRSSQG